MDEYLQRHGLTAAAADVVTGVGFCLLLRRSALEQVGVFDEVYGRGYCEESDLCMRLTTHGYRTVVAGDMYVYHKGRGTFTDQGRAGTGTIALCSIAAGSGNISGSFAPFAAPIPWVQHALFATRQRWNPMPVVWETARAMLAAWRRRDRLDIMLRCALRGVLRLSGARRPLATPEYVRQFTRPGRLR